MMNLLKKKGTLIGSVCIERMPEIKMLSISVSFFPVKNKLSIPPYNGEPPANQYKDSICIKDEKETSESPFKFKTKKRSGYYYLDVGVIAYMEKNNKMFAQVEHFFPLNHPINVEPGKVTNVELNSIWPDIPLEKLGSYGTVFPSKE